MIMSSTISVRSALAALGVLCSPFATAVAEPPTDVLRGPAVKESDIKADRPFTGGKREGGRKLPTKPELEFASFAAAVGAFDIADARRAELVAACEAFRERAASWEKSAAERRKKIYDARKRESPDEPPSEEFKKAITELDASRPKVVELQQQVYALLSQDEGERLKKAYETELAQRREAIAKEVAAERKRKADAQRAAKAEKKGDAGMAEKPAEADKSDKADQSDQDPMGGTPNDPRTPVTPVTPGAPQSETNPA